MTNLIRALMFILLLGACTSSEVGQVNYYLLDKATVAPAPMTNQGNKELMLVSEIRLASYLKKSNLALQLSDHRLYYSREHLWAEPLPLAIKRTLLKDLNQHSKTNHFVTSEHPNSQNIDKKVIVQFDHFIATQDSKVIVAGKYWLVQGNGKTLTREYAFNMDQPLTRDGYPHAVTQLRGILLTLSQQIALHASQQRG